jgi:hypothetical protein
VAKVKGSMVKRGSQTFFYRVANSNRRNNSIESLLLNSSYYLINLLLDNTLCNSKIDVFKTV